MNGLASYLLPWHHVGLIRQFAGREVHARYRQSWLGAIWLVLTPLAMLGIYTLVFRHVMRVRWQDLDEGNLSFALRIYAGLAVFNFFAECVNRAPNLVRDQPHLVKKVVFPLEILPWVGLGAALFHGAVSFGVWLIAYMVFFGLPHATILYLPLILLPFGLFIMGLSWALASLGVYLRDVGQFIGLLTTVLMFLSPIFYPASALPEGYRAMLYMNPLTPVIEQTRDILFWGKAPDFGMLGVYLIATSAIAWLGFAWFQKTRKGFADVL